MATSVNPPPAAPPDDPVCAALDDPVVGDRLRRQALALLRQRAGVRSIEVDDILQKTTERALGRRGAFDGSGRPVGPWLFGVLVNVVREEVRAARRRPAQQPADATAWEVAAVAPAAPDADLADARVRAERYLDGLSPDDAAVVCLRFFDGLDLSVVAGRLGITHEAARMRFSRAMRRLRARAGTTPPEERP